MYSSCILVALAGLATGVQSDNKSDGVQMVLLEYLLTPAIMETGSMGQGTDLEAVQNMWNKEVAGFAS